MKETLQDSVKAKYGAVAVSSLSSNHEGVKAVAEAFGYSAEELTTLRQRLICVPVRWSWILALAVGSMYSLPQNRLGRKAVPSASI